MPTVVLPIHTLLSLSKVQLWRPGLRSFPSPQELTRLPTGSNSITGGARCPAFKSPSSRSCRFRTITWSRASTHAPANPPTTIRSGRGFGQEVSTSYLGTPPCAHTEGKQRIPVAIANAAHVPALIKKFFFIFLSSCTRPSISKDFHLCCPGYASLLRAGIIHLFRLARQPQRCKPERPLHRTGHRKATGRKQVHWASNRISSG